MEAAEEGIAAEVFRNVYIPRRLEEVSNFERDVARLAGGVSVEGLYYQTVTGMTQDATGARQEPTLLVSGGAAPAASAAAAAALAAAAQPAGPPARPQARGGDEGRLAAGGEAVSAGVEARQSGEEGASSSEGSEGSSDGESDDDEQPREFSDRPKASMLVFCGEPC